MKTAKRLMPYLFLAPFLITFIVFRLWPIISAIMMSFKEIKGIGSEKFIGLANYSSLLKDKSFLSSLGITTIFAFSSLVVLTVIPLILSVILFNKNTPSRNLFRTIIFMPSLVSLVAAGTVFRLILSDQAGLLNSLMANLGMQPMKWLLDTNLTIPSLVLVASWRWTGMYIVYFSSGLASIPTELYEAARIDGASRFGLFRNITLPLLKPITVFVITIGLIGGFQVFVEPYVLYSAGRTPGYSGLTLALYIYRKAFRNFDFGYAATIGVVMTGIILIVSVFQLKLTGFFKDSD